MPAASTVLVTSRACRPVQPWHGCLLQQLTGALLHVLPQELWPSLVEKAYARLHGGYAAIASGCVADALIDLTAGVVDTLDMSAGLESEGAVWLHIMQTLSAGNLAVCLAEQHSADTGADPGVPHPSAAAACCAGWAQGIAGLLANSPYSILAAKVLPSGLKLLRLHNPWAPEGVWQGAWGPDAPEWGSEEGQAALAADPAMQEGLQDPATFWCSFWCVWLCCVCGLWPSSTCSWSLHRPLYHCILPEEV